RQHLDICRSANPYSRLLSQAPARTTRPNQTVQPGGVAPGALLVPGAEPVAGYRLLRLLGRGGFGEVWAAAGPGGFNVALKFIRLGELAGTVEARALELMKNIRHAHLLVMFGAWQNDGLLIIAMELADRTLAQRYQEVHAQDRPGI